MSAKDSSDHGLTIEQAKERMRQTVEAATPNVEALKRFGLPKASKRRERTEQDDVVLTIQSCVSALRLTRRTDPEVQSALRSLETWLASQIQ